MIGAVPTLTSAGERFWQYLIASDADAGRDLVTEQLDAGVSGSVVISELLAPAQLAVGQEWQSGRWSVADEHAATAVVDAALAVVESNPSVRPDSGPRFVAVCAESEWHTLPARLAVQQFREAGAQVRFLGPSIPADHLREYLAQLQPDALVLSVTMPTSLAGAARCVAAAHDVGVPVIAGGAAFGTDHQRAGAIQADSWCASAGSLRVPMLVSPGFESDLRPHPRWDAFYAVQEVSHFAVEAALNGLLADLLLLQRVTDSQLTRTREDLHHMLDFLATSLLVDDARLMSQFTCWLCAVLQPRGVPVSAVAWSYQALADELGGLVEPAAAQLLRTQAVALEAA